MLTINIVIIFGAYLNRTRRSIVVQFTADLLGNGGSGGCGLLATVILGSQRQVNRTLERAATVEIVPIGEGFLLFELFLLYPGSGTR